MSLTVRRYDESLRSAWDSFVRASKNGTFLFLRDYMEYHRDRYADFSLIVLDGTELVALLPANQAGTDVHSHQGLTYGGLVTSPDMTTPVMLDAFAAVLGYLRQTGASALLYKTVPTIYHLLPAEEDRYALFLADAQLYRRDVLTVVARSAPARPQTRRRRGAAKAGRVGIAMTRSDNWAGYWGLLCEHLKARFDVAPVHTLEEIERLRTRFPDNIHLHLAELAGEILAGTVIYESANVAHVQYIASSERGRETGALDALFLHLLDETYVAKPFFDFGNSNEASGRVLNRGLIEQKEGFGGRAVVHDFYRVTL